MAEPTQEIEITPEMIEAGVRELSSYDLSADGFATASIVSAVFFRMLEAGETRRSMIAVSPDRPSGHGTRVPSEAERRERFAAVVRKQNLQDLRGPEFLGLLYFAEREGLLNDALRQAARAHKT